MFRPDVHAAVAALGLTVYVLASRLGRQRRPPSAAFAWVLGMLAFPYAALPLFLLLGPRKFVRAPPPWDAADASVPAPDVPPWTMRLAAGLGLPPPRANAGMVIQDDGPQALDALLRIIDGARRRLDLCVFILAGDATGLRVADALAACAGRGCRVRVLLDAVGGMRMPRALRARLAAAGVAVRASMPLIHDPRRARGNLRNHRKLAIADGRLAWGGGRNIADEYFVDRPGRPAWLDLSFVVEGGLAADASRLFEHDWNLAGRDALAAGAGEGTADSAGAGAVLSQLIPSGPDQAFDTLHAYLLAAIYQAQSQVRVATPYFLPGETLMQALLIACRRGVAVSLLLPGRSNHRLADWGRERDLRELAAAGAQIGLLPRMLHAKLVVVDETLALCGSANLDCRSLFLNYEVVAAFHDRASVRGFQDWHARTWALGSPYRPSAPSMARDLWEGLVRGLAFQL